MTEANLLITGDIAFLDADHKSKSFIIDSTFQKQLIQYLVENNIRVIKTEKLNWKSWLLLTNYKKGDYLCYKKGGKLWLYLGVFLKLPNYEKDVMIIIVFISQFFVLFPIKFS